MLKSKSTKISNPRPKSPIDKTFRIRLSLVYIFVAGLGIAVMVRSAQLMLVPSERLSSALERQFRQEPPRMPRRGNIYDRNREALAVSIDVKSLFANPGKMEQKGQVATLLSGAIGIPAQQIRSKLRQDRGFVWIKRQLTNEEEAAVQKVLDRNPSLNLTVGMAKESKRFYPGQSLAAHVLGFTNLDSNGLEGLELYFNKQLSGSAQTSAKGLVLTLDKALQHTLEVELESGVKSMEAISATALIMDAANGDILAMSSYPNYNPNQLADTPVEWRRNRAITDLYEPGSTMKPIMVGGAVEANVVTGKTAVYCELGKLQIGKHQVNEAESKHKWGWLSVEEVIQKSSNIGATKIGFMYGAQPIYNWYKRLGIAEKTGIEYPGEVAGSLPDPKTWSKIAHSNISFGQGMSVTPLQMVRAFAAIANGGSLLRPRLVKEVLNEEGDVIEKIPVKVERQAMQLGTATAVAKMMEKVATKDGTAPKAAIPGFVVVGKTGTAQKAYPGVGYRSGKHIGSFIGYVKDVKPNYVVLVMVDEPKFPYYGGDTGAPIFQKIMSAALAHSGIAPNAMDSIPNPLGEIDPKQKKVKELENKVSEILADLKDANEEKVTGGVPRAAGKSKAELAKELVEVDGTEFQMPNLLGSSATEVMGVFHKKDVALQLRGSGVVVEQTPLPGAKFKKGDKVTVRLEREVL